MLSFNEFVLLKAICSQELSAAVLGKNEKRVLSIIEERYSFEIENGFVSDEELNVNTIFEIHTEELQDDHLIKTLSLKWVAGADSPFLYLTEPNEYQEVFISVSVK